ncbi:MAG: hypothetical protein ACOYNF_16025 [Rhodoferax sp.]
MLFTRHGNASPLQGKLHTGNAILCGDFNLEPGTPEYAAIQQPFNPLAQYGRALTAINSKANHWHDAWPLVHAQAPHAPTFRLFDRSYGPEPIGQVDFDEGFDYKAQRSVDRQRTGWQCKPICPRFGIREVKN